MNKEKPKFIDEVEFNALKLTISDQQMQIDALQNDFNRLALAVEKLVDGLNDYFNDSRRVSAVDSSSTERTEELEKVKNVIYENLEFGNCGLFFVGNNVGDKVNAVFKGKFFTVNHCSGYCYFDVFGCNKQEENELTEYYEKICKEYREAYYEENRKAEENSKE